MNEQLTRMLHALIDRHGLIVKREVVEGFATRLRINVSEIPAYLDFMVTLNLWGCEERDTVKLGWFAPASPEGTVCPRPEFPRL